MPYVLAVELKSSGVLMAMTKYIAETFGINILYGRVMHGNIASVRVLEKNGYEFIKEEFGAEDDPYGNGILIFRKCKIGV